MDQLEKDLVTIVCGGKRKAIPKAEAALRRLMNQVANGNLTAGREFLAMSKKCFPAETTELQEFIFMAQRPPKSGKWVRVR
jgi:hypothetical protein